MRFSVYFEIILNKEIKCYLHIEIMILLYYCSCKYARVIWRTCSLDNLF